MAGITTKFEVTEQGVLNELGKSPKACRVMLLGCRQVFVSKI